jgi:hypothetical protein
MLRVNRNSTVSSEIRTEPVQRAVNNLKRDFEKSFLPCEQSGAEIRLVRESQPQECFCLTVSGGRLEVRASDELGFIYGVYEISRSLLGIPNFWFWNDQKTVPKEGVDVPDTYHFQSKPYAVRYRGWFVNDEVLLRTWSLGRDPQKPWEMVFEALLRCGGNMVIPGTGADSRQYRKLASAMGLCITHHHAEPLGAEMFAQAYPKLDPSYTKYPDKFQRLWQEAIQEQKGMRVIWNLGFRGQGDYPFWLNDPQYQTPESRGRLISKIIRIQYNMVQREVPEAVCCTNLYGEIMELYQDGFLELPDDVIRVWADNGYGKMVSRRQENHNPRVPALPKAGERGKHGVYYHVSFYDLQAGNHITMLPNSPEFVRDELGKVLQCGAKDFWIINCSNVKPHVYSLDFISKIWRDGTVDPASHRRNYVSQYYGAENVEKVSACFEAYPRYALAYGGREDEHAGEQFANHVARVLVSQYMKDKQKRAEELLWATDAESLEGQILWYRELCDGARKGYAEYLRNCECVSAGLLGDAQRLFRDSLLLQVKIYFNCFSGAYLACESLLLAMKKDFLHAFYAAGKARDNYRQANLAMRDREHGKWHNFYANECLTDVKQSAWVLEGLMSYLRNLGDGPHFYKWQREFLYSEENRQVMLILNLENHLKDDELFELMKEKWEG